MDIYKDEFKTKDSGDSETTIHIYLNDKTHRQFTGYICLLGPDNGVVHIKKDDLIVMTFSVSSLNFIEWQ